MFEQKEAQINIIDEHYNIYLSASVHQDHFLSIVHSVLSEGHTEPSVIAARIFRKLNDIITEEELEKADLRIDNSYNLFCNLTIIIDIRHKIVELDGGNHQDDPMLKRYNRHKMTLSHFINNFYSSADL